jgi:hypothetical protein
MVKNARFAKGNAATASANRHSRLSHRGLMVAQKRKTHKTAATCVSCAIGFVCVKKAMACTSIVILLELDMCWTSKSGELF